MKASYKFLFALVLVVVIAVAGWFAFISQSGGELADLSPDAKLSDAQVQALVAKVSQFLVLPADETPSVVVISDAEQLAQQQSFYKGARDGDILVVYSSRAIIYDAKANKLVNVGPIVRNDVPLTSTASGSAQISPSPSGSPVVPEKVTVDVRNGTGTAGLAGATASDLKKNAWITIGRVGDAKGAFKETVIVDLSKGTKPGAVAELERILGVKAVTTMPQGEASSTADILVIVGK